MNFTPGATSISCSEAMSVHSRSVRPSAVRLVFPPSKSRRIACGSKPLARWSTSPPRKAAWPAPVPCAPRRARAVLGGRGGAAVRVRDRRVQRGRAEADGGNRAQQAPACQSLHARIMAQLNLSSDMAEQMFDRAERASHGERGPPRLAHTAPRSRVATAHLPRHVVRAAPPHREEIHVDRSTRAVLTSVALILALAPSAAAAKDPLKVSEDLRENVKVKGIREHLQALQNIATLNGGTRASSTPGYDASAAYVIEPPQARRLPPDAAGVQLQDLRGAHPDGVRAHRARPHTCTRPPRSSRSWSTPARATSRPR